MYLTRSSASWTDERLWSFCASVTGDYSPPNSPIDVIHADDEILVVAKPHGLLSVPGKGVHLADCLLTRLKETFPATLLVHRLDRDTSGVMAFALTPRAQRHLGLQFEKRQVRKAYVARVHGHVPGTAGTIDLPLAVDWPNRPRQMVDLRNGRPAVTKWERVQACADESRLMLFPRTGRSHQLRVHCLAIGHPILGDLLYAGREARKHHRLMLHSVSLRFRHPADGRAVAFSVQPEF